MLLEGCKFMREANDKRDKAQLHFKISFLQDTLLLYDTCNKGDSSQI